MTVAKRFTVPAAGVGRVDFSENVEVATSALIRSHLVRTVWYGEGIDMPAVPFPNLEWDVLLFFKSDGGTMPVLIPGFEDYTWDAGKIAEHLENFSLTTDYNSLMRVKFAIYKSVADLFADVPEKVLWDEWGYGAVEWAFSNGVPTTLGKIYGFQYSVYNNKPTFNLHVHVSSIREEVAGA
jgi:hypothetical protein